MTDTRSRRRGVATAGLALIAGTAIAFVPAAAAQADTTLSGPVNLGTAVTFGVLGATTVTNTGTSVISGDVGVDPDTSITGFPPGQVNNGTIHANDAVALQAQTDLTTAYNVAASLTPAASGYADITGQNFTPGVYSGQAVEINGPLILTGTAESVWVFQVASTLTTGSSSSVQLLGGASACNVFWQVGSSATLGSNSDFVGTIMANQSVTANTGADIIGRLLADNGAVTLDTNTITAPTGCANNGVVATSPTITSPTPTPTATRGTPYRFAVTAAGTGTITYSVVGGTLPAGLTLDSTTGVISGTPTRAGTFTFTVLASNGTAPDASATYTITVAQSELAATGVDLAVPVGVGGLMLFAGAGLLVASRARRARRSNPRHAGQSTD